MFSALAILWRFTTPGLSVLPLTILSVGDVFMEVVHEYPDITVHLTLFHAQIESGEIKLLEHNAVAWITPEEIPHYTFCPADKEINERIAAINQNRRYENW